MYKSRFAEIFIKPTEKRIISKNRNFDLVIIICIVLLLAFVYFITFKNTLSETEKDFKKKQSDDKKNVNLMKIKCKNNKHRLCDYYIASSYNTASMGSKYIDYVSLDAIRDAILDGARYIQLNICSVDVDVNNVNDEPVIATSLENNYHITSLNTIPFKSVVELLKRYAFKVYSKNDKHQLITKDINYPLFIDISINTKNQHVVNKAVEYLKDGLGDSLLDNEKYIDFPIQYEFLCNLTGKIVIFSNNVDDTEMNQISIPQNLLIQKLEIGKIANSVVDSNDLQKYLNSISKINVAKIYEQKKIFKQFIDKIKHSGNNYLNNKGSINKLINLEYDKYGVMNKLDLETKLVFYNSIGLTIITPNRNFKIETYDLRIPIETGCQFIAIPYQDTDNKNYKKYREIFKDSSFILKPNNLRIPPEENKKPVDLLEQYQLVKEKLTNFDYLQEYYRNNYDLMYLQELVSSDYKYAYITKNNRLGFKKELDNILTGENYLLIQRVDIDGINAMRIINPLNQDLCLTVKDNYATNTNDNLHFTKINSKNSKKQLFVIEKPLYEENNYSLGNETGLSIRSILATNTPYYLSIFKNIITLRKKGALQDKFCSFNSGLKRPVFKTTFKSVLFNTHLTVFNTGIVGLSKNLKTEFEVEYEDKINSDTEIVILYKEKGSSKTKKYLCFNGNLRISETKCKFILEKNGNDYSIRYGDKYLAVEKNGDIALKLDKPLLEKAVKSDIGKVIRQERRGPSLGSSKLFRLESKIDIDAIEF